MRKREAVNLNVIVPRSSWVLTPVESRERGTSMKKKNTIQIRQIHVNKNGKSIDLSNTRDLMDSIPSNWSTRVSKNTDRELILLGIFSFGELIGYSYYWFDPQTSTGYSYVE